MEIQNPKSKIKILKKSLTGVKENVLLSDYTTFRLGGPADFFYEAKTQENFVKAIKTSRNFGIPFFVLGRGSNILFDDKGFRGLVIRNLVCGAKISKKYKKAAGYVDTKIGRAHFVPADPKKYLQFNDLDYKQEPFDTEVEVFAGTPLQFLIQWTLEKNLCGLQWFAGIPGSVGGAIAYNIHGGTKLFSDYIKEVQVLGKNNKLIIIKKEKGKFAYDKSRFQKEDLIIVKAKILLSHGDILRARYVYKEWWQRKLRIQPQMNCPGSVFRNFSPEIAKKVGSPTTGAGWFIEQAGLKGKKIGGVQVSEKHANFIVNLGKGKAKDVKKLIKLIKEKVKNKFGLDLKEEILILPEKI
jgi:UDP-N-acetylmuramate dehydrogenase